MIEKAMVAAYGDYRYTGLISHWGDADASIRGSAHFDCLSPNHPGIDWSPTPGYAGACADMGRGAFMGLGRWVPGGGLAHLDCYGSVDGFGLGQ